MAHAYENNSGDLIEKLMSALSAGQEAGGDRRGQQSAAILVVRQKGGYEGYTDRYVDLRVDEHPRPIDELRRILRIYDATILSREDPVNLLVIDSELARRIQQNLKKLRIYDGDISGVLDEATKKSLREFVNTNNFENRMHDDGRIWKSILAYMNELANTN
jgi:uncharacterized Ntn-hydrolase superfamily protein